MPKNRTSTNRRNILKAGGLCLGCDLLGLGPAALMDISNLTAQTIDDNTALELPFREAQYYKKLQEFEIECGLCPRKCLVGDTERGYCGVRENRQGTYFTLVYGNPCSANIDPIEKKPFYHFLPGSLAFSIATPGCNLNCKFCQNWQISQFRPEQIKGMKITPSQVTDYAIRNGCASIAYTYSEPTVFYEYMKDCAIAGNGSGLKSVMVTAGYIEKDPMKELLPHLAAVKVDLKSFSQKYYAEICRGELKPVLDTLLLLRATGIWFEIVYLVLPTLNDSRAELESLCSWIVKELGPEVPVHFTRFHPDYLLKNLPSTPIETLEMAQKIAQDKSLDFPYIGNVPGHPGENTFCPECRSELIERRAFQVKNIGLENGRCKKCGRKIPGVWA